jgi:flagellar hook-length control protein FliK
MRCVGPGIAYVLGETTPRQENALQADPVIAPQSNMITVKTTVSHSSPRGADAFGQILRSAQDTPTSVSKPGTHNPAPKAAVEATPPRPTGSDPAAATAKTTIHRSGTASSESTANPSTKPVRASRHDARGATKHSADQIAAVPAATADPTDAASIATPDALLDLNAATLPVLPSPTTLSSVAGSSGVGAPTGSAVATQALPNEVNPQTGLDAGGLSAAPEPTPAAASSATVASASQHPPVDPFQAASAPQELAKLAAGQAMAPPGKDFRRLRTDDNADQSGHAMALTGLPGTSSQSNPEALPSVAAQPKISSTLPPRASHAPPADDSETQSTNPDNGITFRPVDAPADPVQPAALASTAQQVVSFDTMAAAMPATVFAPAPAPALGTPQAHAGIKGSPAEQVGPALMTLGKSVDGGQDITVQLHPADLGSVQIRIARAGFGGTRVEIMAENSSTLLALQREQPRLHHTLDAAGIPAAGRTVTFHVVPPTQTANRDGSWSGPAGHHGSAAGNAGSNNDANGSAGGNSNNAARKPNSYSNRNPSSNPAATIAASAATMKQTYHIGLDITA